MRRARRRGDLQEQRPGAGGSTCPLVAGGEVELGSDAGVEALALFELGTGARDVALREERFALVEKGLRRRLVGGRGVGASVARLQGEEREDARHGREMGSRHAPLLDMRAHGEAMILRTKRLLRIG